MSKKLLRKVVPVIAGVALTVGATQVALSTSAEAALSKEAQQLCTARCGISYPISAGAGHAGITEGSAVTALIQGAPDTTISVAAFKVDQDKAGKTTLVKVSAPVKVTTDRTGHAQAQVPIQKLTAPLTGGEHFVVQPADTTDPGKLVAMDGKVSYFTVNSTRARVAKNQQQTDHMLTTVAQGLPGDKYVAQLKVDGQWKTVNLTDEILGKDNGVVKSSTNTALLYWRPEVPAGKYPVRFANAKDLDNPVYQYEITVGGQGATPSSSSSAAPTASATPTRGTTATPTLTTTPGATRTATVAPSKSATATAEPSRTATAQPTRSATPGPTRSATAEPTASATAGPSKSATAGPTDAATAEPTKGATARPSGTASTPHTTPSTTTRTPTAEPPNESAEPKVELKDGIAVTQASITPSRVAAGDRYTYTVEVTSAEMSQTKNAAGRDLLIQGRKKASDFTVSFETSPGNGAATCTATADGGIVDGGMVRFTGSESGKVTVSCTYHGPGRFRSDLTLTSQSGHEVFGSPVGYTIGVDAKDPGEHAQGPEDRTGDDTDAAVNHGEGADDGRSTEKNTEPGGKLAQTGR